MLRASLVSVALFAPRATLSRSFLTIIQQGSLGYRLTLGRDPALLQPGLALFLPVFHQVNKVDMRERAIGLDSLHAFTSDNVPTVVSGSLFYRVRDAHKACFSIQNYESSTEAIGRSALRSTVGKFNYDDIISNRNRINTSLAASIGDSIALGIQVTKFEVQTFALANREVERQLEQQMEAERNRRKQLLDTQAAVNVAEGMKQKTILNSEGDLQAKINQAAGEYASTLKVGEALASQISAVAHGLAEASSGPATEAHLARAASIILELRRQEMLKELAKAGNSIYFLSEELGAQTAAQNIALDAGEKWKKAMKTKEVSSLVSPMAGA